MALQDIIDAIIAETDAQIAAKRSEHQKSLTKLREESERRIAAEKQSIGLQKEERKKQLTVKTEAHAEAAKRNALLEKKQGLLNDLYDEVIKKLGAMDDKVIEPLLRECVKRISGKGAIHPSKKHAAILKKICPSERFTVKEESDSVGGFVFVSDTTEEDYTFEHLVAANLRPKTELDIAHSLLV